MPETFETFDSLKPVEAEWEELAIRVGSGPFERPGWFSSWLDAFGSAGLSVLTLRRDGHLAAVLPVLERQGTIRSATNWHTPAYGPVAEDEEAARSLLERLFSARPRRVDLSFLAPESAALLHEASGRRRFAERPVLSSPYLEIDQDWDSYWKGLSGNHRSNIRRRRRRLAEMGEVTVEVIEGGEEVPVLLDQAFQIEASGWKGKKGTAIASSLQTRHFYDGVCAWAERVGLLRLATLRVDDKMAAFNLCLEGNGRHYLLKLGQDVTLNTLGPGTILTAAMVERSFSLGLKSYEFLGDAEPYKLRWAQTCREMVRAQSFASTPAGWGDRMVQTHGRRLAKRVLRRDR
jgi:CelD/BcsL family acetyltransferase involved in cellulose biosynthesis